MLAANASAVEVWTLIIAALAVVSGIASAVLSSVLGKRAEERAETRARQAEERADERARQAEDREEQREQGRRRLEQVRSYYDECGTLAEQAMSMLQGFAFDMAASDPAAVAGARRALHREYVSLETRIGLLGQEMNAVGGPDIGAATQKLVEALIPGQAQLSEATVADDVLASWRVAEAGLRDFRLAVTGALREPGD